MRQWHKWAPGDYLPKSIRPDIDPFRCFQHDTMVVCTRKIFARRQLRLGSGANPPSTMDARQSLCSLSGRVSTSVSWFAWLSSPGDTNKPNLCWFNDHAAARPPITMIPARIYWALMDVRRRRRLSSDLKSIKAKGSDGGLVYGLLSRGEHLKWFYLHLLSGGKTYFYFSRWLFMWRVAVNPRSKITSYGPRVNPWGK
jgi:hypothetical protein